MTLVAWRNLLVVAPVALAQSAAYMALNHFPTAPPRLLSLTAVDDALPFLPWTVWPYLALLLLGPLLPLLIRNPAVFRTTLRAYAVAMGATFATFLVWPTTFPRPPAPTDGGVTSWAYGALVALDGPGCCCPSGHVVVPLVLLWGVWRDRHPWRLPLLALVLALAPAVLTTKQHYAWDVAGAAVVSVSAVALTRTAFAGEGRAVYNRRTEPGAGR